LPINMPEMCICSIRRLIFKQVFLLFIILR
jgi:hypothetical protein